MPNIFYYCPDLTIKSSGIRTLYRHVAHLVKNGLPAAILHEKVGFQIPDMMPVPVRYLEMRGTLAVGDVVAIPEGKTAVMERLKDQPLRKMVICQAWSYVFKNLPMGVDWRSFNIERILTFTDLMGEFLAWAMRLPVHLFDYGIRGDLFYYRPEEKIPQITYLKRKQHNLEIFQRMLYSRNPDYVNRIRWLGMEDLSEEDYAREIRRSAVFLSLSTAEALNVPYLESMRSGTIAAGYDGVGSQQALVASGPKQNCIIAENEDYMTLGRLLEPLLEDLVRGDWSRWQPIVQNGLEYSAQFTLEREEKTIVAIWREILDT